MSNTRKFTVREANELYAALSSLDGSTVIVGKEDDQKAVTVPYRFGGKTRWNLTKALSKFKVYADNFTKIRDDLINEISGGSGAIKPEDSESILKLNKELTAALEQEIEVNGVLSIDLAELNLDDNQIPTVVLATLAPLIKE